MSSRLYKRRLEDVQRQLNQARESLNVLQEQVLVWNDALEDSRIRALVSETPLQAHEYDDLSRHVAVANADCTDVRRGPASDPRIRQPRLDKKDSTGTK